MVWMGARIGETKRDCNSTGTSERYIDRNQLE